MKFYFLTISMAVILSTLSTGCNKKDINLEASLPTEDTYFTTQIQFDRGCVGIYASLVVFYNYRGYSADGFLHDVRLLEDDDLTQEGSNPFESFTTLVPSNAKSTDYFGALYQLNARANTMLAIFNEKANQVYTDSVQKHSNHGEMLFLRGLSHFILWNMYGTAPVITYRINADSALYPSNSTGTQLLDAAINDFVAASQLLPPSWTGVNIGRATSGAALGMAGKAYLYRATVNKSQADYASAAQYFSQITGYSLTTNYYDNFSPQAENNSESLFEVQLGRNYTTEGSNPWLDPNSFAGNGDISGYWGIFDGGFLYGISPFVATPSIQAAFPANDPRRALSMDSVGDVLKYVKGGDNGSETPFGPSYDNNARYLRYADVLLMEAEALVQSGGSTKQAIDLINQVRARARNTVTPASATPADLDDTQTNTTTIMQWIIEERRLELAFEEGIRWADLRRWHMGGVLDQVYGKDLLNGWDFSSLQTPFAFTQKDLYLPIPFSELQLNPNLQQNTLWQ